MEIVPKLPKLKKMKKIIFLLTLGYFCFPGIAKSQLRDFNGDILQILNSVDQKNIQGKSLSNDLKRIFMISSVNRYLFKFYGNEKVHGTRFEIDWNWALFNENNTIPENNVIYLKVSYQFDHDAQVETPPLLINKYVRYSFFNMKVDLLNKSIIDFFRKNPYKTEYVVDMRRRY